MMPHLSNTWTYCEIVIVWLICGCLIHTIISCSYSIMHTNQLFVNFYYFLSFCPGSNSTNDRISPLDALRNYHIHFSGTNLLDPLHQQVSQTFFCCELFQTVLYEEVTSTSVSLDWCCTWMVSGFVTLCTYAQHGYVFGRVRLCI